MNNELDTYTSKTRPRTRLMKIPSLLTTLLAVSVLLCSGEARGGTIYHLYMNPNNGTAVDCSNLPPKDQWWASTYQVNNQEKFDCLMNYALGQGTLVNGKPVDELQIHIEAGSSGSYYTTLGIQWGFATPNTWDALKIYGSGTPKPTVRLINRLGYGDFLQMFDFGWIRIFEMKNLTLDCQWTGGAPNLYSQYYKTGGLKVLCSGGALVDNVTVTNFGAKGAGSSPVTGSGTEAFALSIATADFGQQDTITIQNCEVSWFHQLDGGYCTGIFVVTWGDTIPVQNNCNPVQPGYQRQQGLANCPRPNPVARVAFNSVHDLETGNALGGAHLEKALYASNTVARCVTGFNCDTIQQGPPGYATPFYSQDVTIRDNTFDNCHEGINAGVTSMPLIVFRTWTIANNKFTNMKGWYENTRPPQASDQTKYPLYNECYGIQLNGANSAFTIDSNTFSSSTTAFNYVEFETGHDYSCSGSQVQNFLYGPLLPAPINYWFPIRVIHAADSYGMTHYGCLPGGDCNTHTVTNNKLSNGTTVGINSYYGGALNTRHTTDVCP